MFRFLNITPLRKRRFVRQLNSDGYAIIRIVATGLTADETREYPAATLRDFVGPMQDKLLLEGNIQQGEQTERSDSFPLDKVVGEIVSGSVMYAGNPPGLTPGLYLTPGIYLTPGLYAVARIYAPHKAKIGRWMGRQYGIGLATDIEIDADDADTEIDTESIDSVNIVTHPNAGGAILGLSEVSISAAAMQSALAGRRGWWRWRWWLRTACHCAAGWFILWLMWLILALLTGLTAAVARFAIETAGGK